MLNKKITYVFLIGESSATLIIPIEIARRHGIDKSIPVVIEEHEDGFFIKRLNQDSQKSVAKSE